MGATATTTSVVTIAANQLPVVTAAASVTSGIAPLTVQFTGGCYDSDGSCLTYSWDFKDGLPVNGLTDADFQIVEDGVMRTPITVTPISSSTETTKVDLVFILDTTGSMGGAIDGVKTSIQAFVTNLAASNIDLKLGMVTFGDSVRESFPMNSSVTDFTTFVGNQSADNGNDGPEYPLGAIVMAANDFTYRPGAVKIMVLITDIEMHQPGDPNDMTDPPDAIFNYSTADILALVKNNFVIHVVDNNYGEGDRNPRVLATGSGGASYDLSGGSVDLATLPIKENLKAGYIISFTTSRLRMEHTIRLVVTTPAAKKAEMTYTSVY